MIRTTGNGPPPSACRWTPWKRKRESQRRSLSGGWSAAVLELVLGLLAPRQQIALPLRDGRQSSVLRLLGHSLLELLLGALRRLLREHLPLPVGNRVARVVLLRDLGGELLKLVTKMSGRRQRSRSHTCSTKWLAVNCLVSSEKASLS